MSSQHHHTVAAFLAAVVIAASTAGCTTTSAPSHTVSNDMWKNAGQADAEYRAAEHSLELAPGWHWRATPEPANGPDGRPQFYQSGAATNDATLYWFCSWASTAATSVPGARASNTAFRELATIRTKILYQHGLTDDSRAVFDQVLAGAGHHDLAAVKQFVSLNCG